MKAMNPEHALEKDVPIFLPARMLNEFAYCPRLFYLEYVQGEFEDSDDTITGRFRHKRVDKSSGDVPSPEELKEDKDMKIHAHSVLLSGEKCGFIARIDIIEGEGKSVIPIDYKKGEKPDIPEDAWLPDRVQLCAQGLILRENGYTCEQGIIYYIQSKTRVAIVFDEELVRLTLSLAEQACTIAESGAIPSPLIDSPKCPRCSLVGICLPDEINVLKEEKTPDDVRRLVPARDDTLPVYVQEQGAIVAKKGDELEIHIGRTIKGRARLIEVSQLCLFGNVQVTPQLLHELCRRKVPICYFSYGGWFYGMTQGMSHKNVELRQRQFTVGGDRSRSIEIARRMVNGKIRNCRTLIRRNHPELPQNAMDELAEYAENALKAKNHEELLGIEGTAARIYFLHFGKLLKTDVEIGAFDFQSRNRRPPRDPVNALLSYLYAMVVKDMTVTLLSVGFDPYLGFYHAPKYGKPALALDLMEEFRPLVADSVVLTIVNNSEVAENDFIARAGSVAIKPDARKKVIRAYERRIDSVITHPIFEYSISYRRVFEVQARLLGRYIAGEFAEYVPFCTR